MSVFAPGRILAVPHGARYIGDNALVIDELGDVQGSAVLTGSYATVDETWFDGSDAGFGTAARHLRIPMTRHSAISIMVRQTLGVDLQVAVRMWFGGYGASNFLPKIYQENALATSGNLYLGVGAAGSGADASYVALPALTNPCKYIVLSFTPAADPSSGALFVVVDRA